MLFLLKTLRRIAPMLAMAVCAVACAPPTEAPDGTIRFALSDLNGNVVRLGDERFEDKVVLVDIWGTWCPPCREAIPHLVRLYEENKGDGFEIIGVTYELNGSPERKVRDVRKFVKEQGMDYTILMGTGSGSVGADIQGLTDFRGYPTLILIDRNGQVRDITVGFSGGDEDDLESKIAKLLTE